MCSRVRGGAESRVEWNGSTGASRSLVLLANQATTNFTVHALAIISSRFCSPLLRALNRVLDRSHQRM